MTLRVSLPAHVFVFDRHYCVRSRSPCVLCGAVFALSLSCTRRCTRSNAPARPGTMASAGAGAPRKCALNSPVIDIIITRRARTANKQTANGVRRRRRCVRACGYQTRCESSSSAAAAAASLSNRSRTIYSNALEECARMGYIL